MALGSGFSSLPAGGGMDSRSRIAARRQRLQGMLGGAPPAANAGKLPATGAGGGWMTPGGPGKPPTPDPWTPPPSGVAGPGGGDPLNPLALAPYPDKPNLDEGADFAMGPDAYMKSATAGGGGLSGAMGNLLAALGGGNAQGGGFDPVTGRGSAGPTAMIPTESPYVSPGAPAPGAGPAAGVGLDAPPEANFGGFPGGLEAYMRSFLPPSGGDSMLGGGGLTNMIPDESGQMPAPAPAPKPNTKFPTNRPRKPKPTTKPRQPAGGGTVAFK